MNLIGGDRFSVERKAHGGACIVHHNAVEAKVGSRSRSGVNTHVAHGPANDHLLDPGLFEFVEQARFAKTVGIALLNNNVIRQGLHVFMDFHALCIGDEKSGLWRGAEVLYVKCGETLLTEIR